MSNTTHTASAGRFTVTITVAGSEPVIGDQYWVERWYDDGEEFGDACAMRLRGEEPAAYVARAAASLHAASIA